MSDKKATVTVGKAFIDQLFNKAKVEVKGGDIHENQGYELQPELDKWLEEYDLFLNYQQKQELIQYFSRKMDTLIFVRRSQ